MHAIIGGAGCVLLTLLLTFLCWKEYQNGIQFVPGLHSFGFILDMYVFFFAVAMTLMLFVGGVVGGVVGKKKPKTKSDIAAIIIVPFVIMLLSLAAINGPSEAFTAGRTKAYNNLDIASLANACGPLVSSTWDRPNIQGMAIIYQRDAEFQNLPEAIRKLKPLFVAVARNGVVLQMDGGGVASHEGLWFPTDIEATNAEKYAREHEIQLLSKSPPAFGYCLYDFACLPLQQ